MKGLRANHPQQVTVTATGIVGDRQMFFVDDHDRLLSVTRTGALMGLRAEYDAGMLRVTDVDGPLDLAGPVTLGRPVTASFYGEHNVPAREVTGPWNDLFGRLLERPARLVFADEPNGGCDEFPLTLLGDASVDELAGRSALPSVDARRFRMSIEFAGAAPHAEDTWDGRDVRVGDAVVRVRGPVPRCAAVNRHPDHGDTDLKALHLIRAYRPPLPSGKSLYFGVYADVVTPGTIRIGDPLATW